MVGNEVRIIIGGGGGERIICQGGEGVFSSCSQEGLMARKDWVRSKQWLKGMLTGVIEHKHSSHFQEKSCPEL